MSSDLERALQSDLALMRLEESLIQRAGVLYRMGFTHPDISSSQMAGVGERIRTAVDCKEAKENVGNFLKRQLEKLVAQAERNGKPTSWALPPKTSGGEETLGQTLSKWIQTEKYLEGQDVSKELDRLIALQRFWSRFHGLYRYQAEIGHSMPLYPFQDEG